MAHQISGLLINFRYDRQLSARSLEGKCTFIPLDSTRDGFQGSGIEPFVELGVERRGDEDEYDTVGLGRARSNENFLNT